MKCVICRTGASRPGTTTVTLGAGPGVVAIRSVPAEQCVNCGESYFDEATTERLEAIAEEPAGAGITVAVREYGDAGGPARRRRPRVPAHAARS